MSTNYGTTNAAAAHRDEESQGLLNGQPASRSHGTEANDNFYGRTFVHVSTHRKRYFALWLLAAVAAISTVVGLHFYNKQHEHGGHNDGLRPEYCESDRSYPIAIVLSIFFGYVGVDRFYLGYVFTGLLKLLTAGGFGIWYVIDIILIVLGGLPDHNGCRLVAP